MRGEGRLILGAIRAGGVIVVPAAGIAWALRGDGGALAVVAALAIVVGNLVVSGLVMAVSSRRAPAVFPLLALPSYAFRMAAVYAAMAAAFASPHIDDATFAVAFTAGLTGVLIYECVLWNRTPWLALEFGKEHS